MSAVGIANTSPVTKQECRVEKHSVCWSGLYAQCLLCISATVAQGRSWKDEQRRHFAAQALFGELRWDVTVLTVLYSLAGLGIAIVNDFKSIEGDRCGASGPHPSSVSVGQRAFRTVVRQHPAPGVWRMLCCFCYVTCPALPCVGSWA
jgi:hypothetical protein